MLNKSNYGKGALVLMISEDLAQKLFKENYDYVLRIISKNEKNRTPAEDILQEVFLKVCQSFDQLRDKTKFRPWLRKITINQCYEYYRRHRETLPITVDIPDNCTYLELLLERDLVKRGMSRLGQEDQQLITLRYFLEVSCADIAVIMQISVNNVRVRLFRAKAKLRQILAAQDPSRASLAERGHKNSSDNK
jgi:RNA polymerase sigma-70 factor (ECF subfamily)